MNTETERKTRPETGTTTVLSPVVNIFEDGDGYALEAELPGVNRNGLEVLLEGNELTIVGHREPHGIRSTLLYRESKPADFRRVFELDPAIDREKIVAKIEHGLLTLKLPKTERVKPRQISVSD
jgi:HSP20 family protein